MSNLQQILQNQEKLGRIHHAYLLVGPKDKFQEAIKIIQRILKISPFDTWRVGEEQAIQIADIKAIRGKLYYRPQSGGYSLLVIFAHQNLSGEVSSSLLKILEDPPPTLIIVIGAGQEESLLATILSRCQKIALGSAKKSPAAETTSLSEIKKMPIGKRFEIAESLSVDPGLEEIITAWHEEIRENSSDFNLADILEKLDRLTGAVQSTANTRLALEGFLMALTR